MIWFIYIRNNEYDTCEKVMLRWLEYIHSSDPSSSPSFTGIASWPGIRWCEPLSGVD